MTSTTVAAPADLSSYPLIPREALFGNPLRASGQISPDGKWLSWLVKVMAMAGARAVLAAPLLY